MELTCRDKIYIEEKDIIPELVLDNGKKGSGPVLINDGLIRYIDNSESMVAITGATGAGKTQSVILPALVSTIKAEENFALVATKHEVLVICQLLKSKGYNYNIIDLTKPTKSDGFNFLKYMYELSKSDNSDIYENLLASISSIIVDDSLEDKFWSDAARNYLQGCIKVLFKYCDPSEINIKGLHQIVDSDRTTVSKDVMKNLFTFDKNYTFKYNETDLSFIYNHLEDGAAEKVLLSGIVDQPKETRGGIISCCENALSRILQSEGIIDLLCRDEVDLNNRIGDKDGYIIIIPDYSDHYSKLSQFFIECIYSHYLSLAENNVNGRLEKRLNIFLEELGNIGSNTYKQLPMQFNSARSRNIRFYYCLQALSQLYNNYSDEQASSIINSTGIMINFRYNYDPRMDNYLKTLFPKHFEGLIKEMKALPLFKALIIRNGKPLFNYLKPFFNSYTHLKGYDLKEFLNGNHNSVKSVFNMKNFLTKLHKATVKNDLPEPKKDNSFAKFMEGGLSIDDMIKEIDEKIAKLDKQDEYNQYFDDDSYGLDSLNSITTSQQANEDMLEMCWNKYESLDYYNYYLEVFLYDFANSFTHCDKEKENIELLKKCTIIDKPIDVITKQIENYNPAYFELEFNKEALEFIEGLVDSNANFSFEYYCKIVEPFDVHKDHLEERITNNDSKDYILTITEIPELDMSTLIDSYSKIKEILKEPENSFMYYNAFLEGEVPLDFICTGGQTFVVADKLKSLGFIVEIKDYITDSDLLW